MHKIAKFDLIFFQCILKAGKTNRPRNQFNCLQKTLFSRSVGTDQYGERAQFDRGFREAFEVFDRYLVDHQSCF
jgi:hypothetical protein